MNNYFYAESIRWRSDTSVNCLDQHVHQSPDRVALIWEKDEPGTEVKITYRELLDMTCRLANTLKKYGVQKGDRVAIYMPVTPLAVAAMLACARIGAIHTVVFAGFSAESLAGRIIDSGCKAVITYNQGVRGGRVVELKKTVDEAVKNCPTVKHVFVAQRTDSTVHMGNRDIPLEEEMAKEAPVCAPESMDSEDMLFMLYTSGSTGQPKGIVHTQAGYLLYAAVTHKHVFDYQQGDVFGCVADIGWITGHSYVVYGPLCNGGTSVLFESTPLYPDPGRYWETVQRLKINQFYGAPTAVRLLLKYGDKWVKKYDRSSLKTLGSVGEPINHEAWQWFYNVVGDSRCTLVDTWWQTETGGICIAPRPSEEGADIIPAMAMRPFFGIIPALMDENVSAFAFIVLKEDTAHTERVKEELRSIVASKIAKYAVPDHVLVVKRLPKTRSGKIMRRVLKKIVADQSSDLGDVTTLDDPSIVAEILDAYQKYKTEQSASS
ncbi:acetyl-coenzyme A synthetase 2-like, mitochondrial [Terrapene carolina triunguis]|uniref:acetyl-coenzyme A synthetase 2-like, mitochondrial n=1 Tax=Terrapene triunguis TaxID=2587831 RepID=UPI000E77E285|nr:acetyl-coenzyme A synthetase 2-like, mitochondrial [Terrapene carolina triunguis]